MTIEVAVKDAKEVSRGVWEAVVAPRDVRTFGPGTSAIGDVSVLLLEECEFDAGSTTLRFSPQTAHVLNVGQSDRAIILGGSKFQIASQSSAHIRNSTSRAARLPFGAGDRRFVEALKELPPEIKTAGEQILKRVREHFPGDLLPVGRRRFQETPDNFWFITVQPRDRSLSITVRGLPHRFHPGRLRIVEDRRPYSRFKITAMSDVEDAVKVILAAVRRGQR